MPDEIQIDLDASDRALDRVRAEEEAAGARGESLFDEEEEPEEPAEEATAG
jgi:hypothetical protein